MSRLHDLERRIDEKLRGLLRSSSPDQRRELLEVHRAVLDDVAAHVDTLPRGKQVFAYTQLDVQILLPDPALQRSYELVFIEADTLSRDIRQRLEDQRVELPAHLSVQVELVPELPPDVAARGFDVHYGSAPIQQPSQELPEVRFTVISGSAQQPELLLKKRRINLGRLAEVIDAEQRLTRQNDVAFRDDAPAPNQSVSRAHAHVEFDSENAAFRLYDDRSAHGTTVVRDGTVIPVPPGPSKGVAMRDGDEIVLGQARLRFEIMPNP
jgi:pSer/pThr/pTyr-binding forkhead associated (FHA) protein